MGKDKQINTPVAIIVAGLLVMAGIIITGGFKCNCQEIEPKTLSEEIGVTKDIGKVKTAFADQTFRINRQPATRAGIKYIGMMNITM